MQQALEALARCSRGACLALWRRAPPAQAQMTVIDPTNLAQNLLQVARALEQINNQIRQIEQQAQMLRAKPAAALARTSPIDRRGARTLSLRAGPHLRSQPR